MLRFLDLDIVLYCPFLDHVNCMQLIFTYFVRMNVTGFGPLNWIAGKSVTNVIQENVLQVNNAYLSKNLKLEGSREYEVL